MRHFVIVAAVILAPAALAAEAPDKIVAHINVIQSDEAEQKRAEATLDKVVAELETQFVSPAEAAKVLKASPCYASAEVDACLAALARQTGAGAALFLVAAVHTRQIALTGRLVSTTGEIVKPPVTRTYPNAPAVKRDEALARALRSYFREELGMADLIPPLTDTGPETAAPPVDKTVAPPTAGKTGPGPARLASYGLIGAGALSLAGCGAVVLLSSADREALSGRLDEAGRIRDGDGAALALHDQLKDRGALATALGVAGAAALLTGGVLFLLSGDEPPPVVTAAPVPGGAGLFIEGSF